jgi:predicted protein tyrosine phosphatase
MIAQFNVYNRQMIELIEPYDDPHLIVSIRTPGDPKEVRLPLNAHTLGVVHLQFHDLNDAAMAHVEIRDQYEAQCFNQDHARQILWLVKAFPTAERLIVHCDAGLSRSPAVAAAFSKILTGDDSRFFKQYSPNSRVYRSILDEHFAQENEHGNDRD